jgi:hypothetical protein
MGMVLQPTEHIAVRFKKGSIYLCDPTPPITRTAAALTGRIDELPARLLALPDAADAAARRRAAHAQVLFDRPQGQAGADCLRAGAIPGDLWSAVPHRFLDTFLNLCKLTRLLANWIGLNIVGLDSGRWHLAIGI